MMGNYLLEMLVGFGISVILTISLAAGYQELVFVYQGFCVGTSQEHHEVLSGWRLDSAAGSHQTWSSDWIKRSAVSPHTFLLAASWTVAGSPSAEIHSRRTMDLFSVERASRLRRCVKKFTLDGKGA